MSRDECACVQFASLCFIRQVKSTALLLSVALVIFAARGSAETIWIDTDISIGSPLREVDDAFALLLANNSPDITIEKISTTYGNASLKSTTAAACAVTSRMTPSGLSLVYAGARSPNDVGRETNATSRLAAALQRERLTYVALGPLTNLASFQLRHPSLAQRINRVVFIGGTFPRTTLRFGRRHPIKIHDANVIKDRAAVAQVLRSGIPITIIPVEIAAQLTVTASALDAMRGDPARDYIERHSRFWLWFWTKFVGTDGAPIFDAAAILALTDPKQFAIETRTASIDPAGNLIIAAKSGPGGRNVSTVVRFRNRENAVKLVRRRLRSSAGRVP
jgi:inosine-uridine nucleoside N-ribohydrolase